MSPKKKKIIIRGLAILLAVVAGFVFLPAEAKLVDWQEYDAALIDEAIEAGKPVLIKFTADWCQSCATVDRRVFKKKDVAKLIEQKGVLAIYGDTTTIEMAATKDLAKIYKEPGIPVTVIYVPDGEKVHLRGLIGKTEVKDVLEELPDVE